MSKYANPMERADAFLAAKGLGPVQHAYWLGRGWVITANPSPVSMPSPYHAPEWDGWIAVAGPEQGYIPRGDGWLTEYPLALEELIRARNASGEGR